VSEVSGVWRLAFAGLAGALLAGAALLLARHQTQAPPPVVAILTAVPTHAFPTRTPTPHPYQVYVTGAVATPGVYTVRPGTRADDALAAAGGALPDADLEHINLAAPLTDGEQITVHHLGDPTATPAGGVKKPAGRIVPTATPLGDWLLNINTASATDFRALPGIGKTTADHIVSYRDQHGPYAGVDDLLRAGLRKPELDRIRSRLTVQ